MLVLHRRIEESLVFEVNGIAIEVHVSDIIGSKVKLAIDAPPSVTVLRGELAARHVDGAHAACEEGEA